MLPLTATDDISSSASAFGARSETGPPGLRLRDLVLLVRYSRRANEALLRQTSDAVAATAVGQPTGQLGTPEAPPPADLVVAVKGEIATEEDWAVLTYAGGVRLLLLSKAATIPADDVVVSASVDFEHYVAVLEALLRRSSMPVAERTIVADFIAAYRREILGSPPGDRSAGAERDAAELSGGSQRYGRAAAVVGATSIVLAGAMVGAFAANPSTNNTTWIVVGGIVASATAVSWLIFCSKARSSDVADAILDVPQTSTAYAAMALSTILGVVGVELATGFDPGSPQSAWIHELLILIAAGGAPVLVALFVRRKWSLAWLAALAGGMATLDARLRSTLVGVGGVAAVGVTCVVVPVVIHQLQREANDPIDGSWYISKYAIHDDPNWLRTAEWTAETWAVSKQTCRSDTCAVQVYASTGQRFILTSRRGSRTWAGARTQTSSCGYETNTGAVVTTAPNGYQDKEELSVVLAAEGDVTGPWFTVRDHVTGVVAPEGRQHDCVTPIHALVTSTASRIHAEEHDH